MPPCNCASSRCGGKIVTQRTLDKHHHEDKRQYTRQAFSVANQVCEEQDDEIASYISSLTLSDNASGAASPGGRLWSHSVNTTSPHDDSQRLYITTKPISTALSELRDIEKDLQSLINATVPDLKTLGQPSNRSDDFPLKAALSSARSLQDKLASITNRACSVRESKATVTARLDALLGSLKEAKNKWNTSVRSLPEVKHSIPTHNTGEYFVKLTTATLMNFSRTSLYRNTTERGPHYSSFALRYGRFPSRSPCKPSWLSIPSFHAPVYHPTDHDAPQT